jgi:hypothetical protein
LKSLITFFAANFCCRQCCKHIDANYAEKSPLQLKVSGIATGLHFNCSHGASASLHPDVPHMQEKVETKMENHSIKEEMLAIWK